MSLNMHSNIYPVRAIHNLKALSVAVASALVLMSGAGAAGLGKLTVLSSLGQPLRAEIAMTAVAKADIGTLTAKLASPAVFRQANIDFNPALMSLRFAIEQRGDASVIRISSSQPMNEPFVDMLLELSGAQSHLVREYTFLLDPADLRMTQPAQVAAPVSVPLPNVASGRLSGSQSNAQSGPVTPAPLRRPQQDAAPRTAKTANSPNIQDYQVKKGDSLAGIARQVKPAGVSLDQMLVALYRHNPDAFVDKNMNRLRAGEVLSIPDAQSVGGVASTEARSIVVAQTKDFNEYRNRLAGQVANSNAKQSTESRQSATGKITSTVEEPAGTTAASRDRLKLSKAGAVGAKGAQGAAAPVGAEDLIAKDKALADANARVQALEKNLADLQKLLEIKNKNLAEQQQQADGAKTGAAVTAVAPVADAKADVKTTEVPGTAAAEKNVAATKDSSAPDGKAAGDSKASEPVAVAAPVVVPPAAVADKPKPVVVAKKPVAPAPVEQSFVSNLLDNPLLLPGSGLLLVALGAFGIYNSRRKKKQKQFTDSILADSSLKANSLFGSTGGQSVDTNNSVFNSSFSPTASQLDTNEVDPVAEADVYIAYGRDAQAEEILKEALRTQPERHPVRVKLLEIYAGRKDLRSFELQAGELYGMTKGLGDDWAQAASLGLSIDPSNPLYAGGKLKDETAHKVGVLSAPTEPLEELDLDALLATTQPAEILGYPDTVETTAPDARQLADLSAEFPTAGSNVAAHADAPPKADPMADLDFDLGDFAKDLQPEADAPAAPIEAAPTMDFSSLDFDLNPATPAKNDVESGTAEASELSEPDAMTPLLPLETDESVSIAQSVSPLPAADAESDESLVGNSAKLTAAPLASHVPAASHGDLVVPDFDLSGIDLDLGNDGAEPQEHEAGADPYSAEMSTKLDLAQAYREIGDKEGARELLDEVIKDGSQQQVEKAKLLLSELV